MNKSHKSYENYDLIVPKNEIIKIFKLIKGKSNESCGVLIGYRRNKYEFFLTHIIHDDKPINPSKSGISRNTRNVYPYVKNVVENSTEDIDYIGEWHSHLYGNCRCSNIDSKSMKELMEDPDYKFPVFLILIILKFPDKIKAFLIKKNVYLQLNMNVILV